MVLGVGRRALSIGLDGGSMEVGICSRCPVVDVEVVELGVGVAATVVVLRTGFARSGRSQRRQKGFRRWRQSRLRRCSSHSVGQN